jgi:acetylornithine deacetylase/succinyl-diaminopimelate desuccinylase-like protein
MCPSVRSTALVLGLSLAPVGGLLAQSASYDEAAKRLAAHPSVERAMKAIDESDARTMAALTELTQIPAPPFGEAARGRRFLALLREAGVDTAWVDEVGNVIGLRRGTGSGGTVAIAGHLDTVFPEGTDVTLQIKGDTLYAPGVGDDTRGLAAVLALVRAMNAAGVRTDADILFVGNVGEEGQGDLRGMKHLFRDGGPPIASFISIDGTGHEGITHQGLGSHRYRVVVRGPGGHSWGAFGLANPAHALGRSTHYFDMVGDSLTRSGPRTSYNVGVIGGGTSVNSIPFEAWMDVDMRSESPASLERIDAALHASVERAVEEENAERRRGEALTFELELIGDRPSGEVAEDAPIVQRAAAVSRMLGIEPRLGRSSTDANIPISKGIPAITIGGGGVAGGAHSLHEWFLNENGTLGIKRALLILLSQAGLAVAS